MTSAQLQFEIDPAFATIVSPFPRRLSESTMTSPVDETESDDWDRGDGWDHKYDHNCHYDDAMSDTDLAEFFGLDLNFDVGSYVSSGQASHV